MLKEKENPNITVLAGDTFSNVTDKRVEEYRKKWSLNPVEHVIESFPIHLDIESTSKCNLKCPFCAGTHETYSHGYMSIELFKKIIDEGSKKGLCSVKLNFRGEPLLHPQISDMVAYAKDKGIIDVFFNTNATLLNNEAGEKLINAGLDRLIVSFEGFTKEMYEKNRVGANFESVFSNITDFVKLRKKLNSRIPAVRLQSVAISTNEEYFSEYRNFWKEYADEITCIDLRDEKADYSSVMCKDWECPYPWLRLCITWEGLVYTCPFVTRSSVNFFVNGLGSINENRKIWDFWNGQQLNAIREAHTSRHAHLTEPCRYCSYRGTELSKKK